MRVSGVGAMASRTNIEIDAPTTKLQPSIMYGVSNVICQTISNAIANKTIIISTNRGGLYWLDKINALNQKRQNLIRSHLLLVTGYWSLVTD
jgi:hypothetical protein